MVVEIPGDFSKDASTVMNKHPKKLNLIYHTNAGRNYVGAQISDKAIEQLQHSVGSEISEQYAEVIFDNFGKIAKGLGEASSGAEKLNESLKDAKNGSKTLKDNLEKLAKSQITFNNKMGQFGTAFNTLNEKSMTLIRHSDNFRKRAASCTAEPNSCKKECRRLWLD